MEPLELLLPESEELLLPLSREGPEPPFSETKQKDTAVLELNQVRICISKQKQETFVKQAKCKLITNKFSDANQHHQFQIEENNSKH